MTDDPPRATRPNDARIRFAALNMVQALWQADHGGPAQEATDHFVGAIRTLHPYAIESADLKDVERAFGEIRDWKVVSSLAELVKRRKPLLVLRCKADKAQALAAVWSSTRVGTLLVTGHLFVSRLEGDSNRPARMKAAGLDTEMWAPRLGAVDLIASAEAAADLLPLVCSRCRRESPLTWAALIEQIDEAKASRPGRHPRLVETDGPVVTIRLNSDEDPEGLFSIVRIGPVES